MDKNCTAKTSELGNSWKHFIKNFQPICYNLVSPDFQLNQHTFGSCLVCVCVVHVRKLLLCLLTWTPSSALQQHVITLPGIWFEAWQVCSQCAHTCATAGINLKVSFSWKGKSNSFDAPCPTTNSHLSMPLLLLLWVCVLWAAAARGCFLPPFIGVLLFFLFFFPCWNRERSLWEQRMLGLLQGGRAVW